MSDPLYVIAAQVIVLSDGGRASSRDVPTFLLDPVIQGITDADHAARIGMSVLTSMLPYGAHKIDSIHVAVLGPDGKASLSKVFEEAHA